ncbi:MAG: amidoligase family protein [Thermotaleaceae bacterium]
MPKSRARNTIASAAGGENGGTELNHAQEMAQRLENRIHEIGTLHIPIRSSSRAREEMMEITFDRQNPGRAAAASGSGRIYQVDYENHRCTCMDHRIRGRRCRHIEGVHQALGQINRGLEIIGPSPGMASSELPPRADEVLHRIDTQEEEERRTLDTGEIDDEFLYSDHEEEFIEAMQRAVEEELVYEYENVLNGSENTFGIELEFVDGDADAIARELYHLGICSHDRRLGYHSQGVPGKWKLEKDGSVSDGPRGGELVSPVLTDTPETWRTIEKICEVAKRHGAAINHKCGGHVHIGIAPLNTARQRWKRFFRAIGGFEDILYRLAGGSLGRIRSNYSHYATPFQDNARRTVQSRFRLEERGDIDQLARRASNQNRYHGINLTNIYESDKPNTVEFRYFNGSLDPAQIQANVKVANGVITAAQKVRTRGNITEITKKRGQMLTEQPMGENSRRDHSAVKKFVDIFFSRKKDKDMILGVYARNTWA